MCILSENNSLKSIKRTNPTWKYLKAIKVLRVDIFFFFLMQNRSVLFTQFMDWR